LYRAGDEVHERLTDGASVRTGDELFLEIEGTKKMYVYVVNVDKMGAKFVLFPLPGLDQENPLPPNESHRLPGGSAGSDNYWGVSSAGGQENFLVIASPKPLEAVEQYLRSIPRASASGSIRLDTDLLPGLRGIGTLIQHADSDEQTIEEIFSSLGLDDASGTDVEIWHTRLNNPVN
jgi:hypothetical protein